MKPVHERAGVCRPRLFAVILQFRFSQQANLAGTTRDMPLRELLFAWRPFAGTLRLDCKGASG